MRIETVQGRVERTSDARQNLIACEDGFVNSKAERVDVSMFFKCLLMFIVILIAAGAATCSDTPGTKMTFEEMALIVGSNCRFECQAIGECGGYLVDGDTGTMIGCEEKWHTCETIGNGCIYCEGGGENEMACVRVDFLSYCTHTGSIACDTRYDGGECTGGPPCGCKDADHDTGEGCHIVQCEVD